MDYNRIVKSVGPLIGTIIATIGVVLWVTTTHADIRNDRKKNRYY